MNTNVNLTPPSATHPHYQSYIDQFNIDELEQQILVGCRIKGINGINAYVECVSRHAQSDKVAIARLSLGGIGRQL